MHQVLLIVQVLVAVGLIGLVLIQHGKGADVGAAFGSGASGSVFGSRGATSFLSKMTAVLAAAFFANSIALAYIAGQSVDRRSVTEVFQASDAAGDSGGATSVDEIPRASAPEDEAAPTSEAAETTETSAPSQGSETSEASEASAPAQEPKDNTSSQ